MRPPPLLCLTTWFIVSYHDESLLWRLRHVLVHVVPANVAVEDESGEIRKKSRPRIWRKHRRYRLGKPYGKQQITTCTTEPLTEKQAKV